MLIFSVDFADENGIVMNPPKIIIDFEAAMKEAIQEVFPQSSMLGCYFHWNKCIFRRLSQEGLITLHRDDGHFRTLYGRIKVSHLCVGFMLIIFSGITIPSSGPN